MKNQVFLPFCLLSLFLGSNYLTNLPVKAQNSTENSQSVWQPFASGEGGFSILLPGTPERVQQTLDTDLGRIELTGFATLRPEEAAYLALYADLPSKINVRDNPDAVNELLDGGAEYYVNESNGQLLSKKNITIENFPGRELRVMLPNNVVARHRLILVKNRLYQLVVITPKEEHLQGSINGFFDSFQLTTLGVAVASIEDMNSQLNQELCSQNWARAVNLLNQMIASLPSSESTRNELIDYRIRIQGIANSNTSVPDNIFDCSAQ